MASTAQALLPLALLVLLAANWQPALCEDFYSGTDVVDLTASNFRSKVLEDDHIWMIEFYAPWCGHCQRLKPDYIKAATASKGIVRFGAINCDDHKSMASQYGVRGFPTLKLFGQNKKKPEDYNGARTAKAMSDAAIALLPNHVTVVTSKAYSDFLSRTPELPRALLFTSKAATTPLYKALALDLKGRMLLGEVRGKKETGLMEQHGVKEGELPVLMVLPVGVEEGEERPRYSGELKHKPLRKFLEQFAIPKKSKSSSKSDEKKATKPVESTTSSSTTSSASKPAAPRLLQLKSSEEAESACPKGPGFCVVAVLAGGEGDEVDSLQALAAKYHGDPIKFLWVDASSSPSIAASLIPAQQLSVLPAVVVVNAKRGKYVLHSEGLASLSPLLDRVVGGDLQFKEVLPEGWGKPATADS